MSYCIIRLLCFHDLPSHGRNIVALCSQIHHYRRASFPVSPPHRLTHGGTGDAAVGKSSLLVRLTDQRFLANPDPTLGVEFGSKLITLPEENKVIKLQCWDTAGTESFRSITRSYYRGAAGCLLVYDVTSRKSFKNARSWLADVREHADPHLTCILVGNKVDLCEADGPSSDTETIRSSSAAPRRQVPTAEAEQWAKEEGLLFVETSAKLGQNVEFAFEQAAKNILDKIKKGVFDDDRSPGVKLSKPSNSLTLEQGPGRSTTCCS